jgi:sterol desaturase/sphingolipid hydroxylase (fatty acid hydroxylase superfamily)
MFSLLMLGGSEVLLILCVLPLGLLTLAFWIWMLIDAAQNRGLDHNERIVWIIVVALLHFIGALIYFFAGRPKRRLAPGI